ncbi:helicase associated domain-containing protein [Tunicatimonas pelagia]|uniref:helicase associated domain-containing protein n=1 Tax=Tunicatimonas pelagia TaxID=931531 RepID=UPI002665B81E|nr:helicase associated domain-containing protein [Tunicatimonas pelagia]WKN44275.1 helicase associated domain-containing protein [Tunicatimonas pelagia]
MLQELQTFFFRFGHCYVPARDAAYQDLYRWCKQVRDSRSRLSDDLITELDQLGFDWQLHQPQAHAWMFRYHQLRQFYEQHGHCYITAKDDASLYKWATRQRSNERSLSEERRALLKQIHFPWQADMQRRKEERWQSHYQQLRDFQQAHGHLVVPAHDTRYHSLALWVQRQRDREEELDDEKREQLNAIGFRWKHILADEEAQRWPRMYEQLKNFVQQHGHAWVPNHSDDYPQLASWVSRQRQQLEQLSDEQKAQLNAVGFAWKGDIVRIKRQRWHDRYEQLKNFVQQHGHCRVPNQYPLNPELGRWVEIQRTNPRLSPKRRALLNQLGFTWSEGFRAERKQRWKERYGQLQAFFVQHGHSQVPEGYADHPDLALWVSYLRQHPERVTSRQRKQLSQLDFRWSEDLQARRDARWMEQYRKLVAFRRKQGHTRLPITHPDQKLARWVAKQRRNEHKLSQERKNLLNQVGFTWRSTYRQVRQQQWDEKVAQLQDFHQRYGHCRVPYDWPEDKSLARWVSHLRRRKAKLTEEQITQLDALAFVWDAKVYTFQKPPMGKTSDTGQ